jgi:hypothetical protein
MPVTGTRESAASGFAVGAGAVRAAVAAAVRGVRDPGLVVFFSTCDVPRAAASATAAAGGCPVAGMTVSAALSNEGPHHSGCAAVAFDGSFPTGVGVAERASNDLVGAARAATTTALGRLPADMPGKTVLLFADTRSGDQAEVIAGAYSVAGPGIPLAGGGAGGPRPAQFAGPRALDDSVVAVAIGSRFPIGVGVADGCRPVGVPSIVTRAHGRILLELDGRPAEAVYREKLAEFGEPRTEAEFERFAVLHPLAQPELGGHRRLRHVLGLDPHGGLHCATAVPPNAAVEFMVQEPELVVRSGREAVARALAVLGTQAPAAALVFDCAGRKRALDDQLDLEVQAIQDSFANAPAIAGGYTHGEIGRARGAKGDRNHAVVVVAIG